MQTEIKRALQERDITTNYTYDGMNRLIKADDGTNVSTYTYDGNNLRQSKTVNGVTTQHIYNGMNVVQEKEGSSLKVSYHRVGSQIIYSEVNGSNNFYIYNAQGNVSKLLNTAYETAADYTFDAFGVQKSVNGEIYNPFRYCGEYYDDELGYTYLRNRYYNNSTGRFITEDPIKDGLNWYGYASNNPVMLFDPSGLADVPKDGVESIGKIITQSQIIIKNKLNYLSGETVWASTAAQKARDELSTMISDIKSFSPKLADLVENVIVSNKGSIQQISSIIAICIEMRYTAIEGSLKSGDEVIPEDKINPKYDYYVRTGDIFLQSDNNGWKIEDEILPETKTETMNQNTFTGTSGLLGYWVRVIMYDRYKKDVGDGFEHESNAKDK